MVDLRDLCMTSKVDNYSADHTLGLQALHLQLLNIWSLHFSHECMHMMQMHMYSAARSLKGPIPCVWIA